MSDPQIEALKQLLLSKPRPAELAERRKRVDGFGSVYTIPHDVQVQPVDANGVRAEWTSTPVAQAGRVVMFLHGGAYVSGSLQSHRHLVAQIGREAHARTLALDYRLAPEHPFPAGLEDAIAGYRFLLAQGYRPGNIALAGESAGGGLALALLVSLREQGIPLPACAWLSSPWVDLALSGDSMVDKAEADPLIQPAYLAEVATLYLGGADSRTPLASPLYADLQGLPPMLIQVGSAEVLLDDAVRLARKAAMQDVRVNLEVWPDMIHAWSLFYQQVDAGKRSLASMGLFLREQIPSPQPYPGTSAKPLFLQGRAQGHV